MGEPTFAVLGPLRVRAGGVPVRVGGPKPRAVLATLLLRPGGFVSVDLLTEVLWPGGAPRSAVANVRTYVRALRRTLSEAGIAVGTLSTQPAGYAFDVPPAALDLSLFARRLAAARADRDRGDDPGALRGYEAALGLWRGGVLQDMPSSVVWDSAITRAEEARSAAVGECLETRLRLGDYAPLVTELRSRLAEDPLREDLWQMLVHALHGAGRTAEARAAYAEAERVLAAELGAEPGASLRRAGAHVDGHAHRRVTAPVRQLPIDVPDFTGRAAEIAALYGLLSGVGRQPVVAVLSGPPGAGKSTLAVHVAHRVRDAFPDGQLFVDLGGMSDRPRTPADVLAEMLRGLGVIDSTLPAEPGERAALLRSRLAQRRFLILLDDAAGTAQVRFLLPGTGGSAVLVTSRRRMPGLPARHFPVGVLERADARALFGAIVGPQRLHGEAAEADRVLEACGSLPLAVRIAGARLANRPGWTVGTLADHLHDERGQLDQLQTGELAVRASVELSYRHLSERAATAFRAFGQLPDEAVPGWLVAVAVQGGAAGPAGHGPGGPEGADPAAATGGAEVIRTGNAGAAGAAGESAAGGANAPGAGAAGSPAARAASTPAAPPAGDPDPAAAASTAAAISTGAAMSTARALETLADEHLVEAAGADRLRVQRYRMHNLVHRYAQELAEQDDAATRTRRRLAVLGALVALARCANSAMPTRFLGVLGVPGEPGPVTGPATPVAQAVRARPVEWFETERRILVAAVESAVRFGHTGEAADLAIELAGFFDMRGHYGDWMRTHRLVLDATPAPSGAQVAALLRNLGQLHLYQDRYTDALASFDTSRTLFAGLGHVSGEAVAALGAGAVHRAVDHLDAALDAFAAALRGFRTAGDRHGEAVAHNAIASVWLERRDPEAAARWLDSALRLSRDLGDRHREAQVRRRIAVLHELRREPHSALAELERALGVFDDLADVHCAAYVQQSIGELWLRQGDPGQASALLVDALAVQRQLGDRRAEARVACLLGELHHATGRDQAARRYFHRSLSAWHRLKARDQAELVDAKLRSLR